MKRLFGYLLAMITLLAMAPQLTPAFADSSPTTTAQVPAVSGLAIKAPEMAEVGKPVTITVFAKHNRETIAGGSVYALKTSELVITADKANYAALVNGFEALAEAKGFIMGTTGASGELTAGLPEAGRFILVATRDGFVPGFARVTVTLAARKALNIRIPGKVEMDIPVEVFVAERFGRQPVANAAVYARLVAAGELPVTSSARAQVVTSASANVTSSSPTVLGPKLAGLPARLAEATIIKADPSNVTASITYAAEIRETGTLLGYSDGNGKLVCTFKEEGVYILTATLDGHAPGFAKTTVTTGGKGKLALKSPQQASAGEIVTLIAVDRGTGQGIGGVEVWALGIDDIKGTAEKIWESLTAGSAASEVVDKYRGWARDKGIRLGTSSDSGEVNCTFMESGRYLLAAVRDVYAPGFNRIRIGKGSGQEQLTVKVPISVAVGQTLTVKVSDRTTGEPVQDAQVNAIRSRFPEPPMVRPTPPPVENGTATQMLLDTSSASAVSTNEARGLLAQSAIKPLVIGSTDANGEVQYAFTETGMYVVTATKEGHAVGGARVNVGPMLPLLHDDRRPMGPKSP